MPFRFLLGAVAAVLFSACSMSQQTQPPDWVQHPPEASATELYGVSVAHSPSEAVVSAAGGIASGVLSAAHPLLDKEVSDAALRARTAAEMKSILEKMDYSSIRVKEQVAVEKDTAVLVSMPRSTFATELAERLRADSQQITGTIAEHAGDPEFVRLGTIGALHEEQPHFLAEIVLLETVDPTMDLAPYRTQSQQIESDYNALKFGMGVNVISDATAIVYVDTMQNALRSEGLNPSAPPSGTILLAADSQREFSGGVYSVKTRLRIQTTVKGERVSASEHYLQATSPEGYPEASRKTAKALADIIAKTGLFHTLGF